MTDLTAFGVDVGEAEQDTDEEATEESPNRTYRNGRCPGINTDGTRCSAPVSRMNDADGLCGTHGRQRDAVTIHDGPKRLIEATARDLWRNLEFEDDRQRRILHRMVGIDNEPLEVSEDGLWLPERFREAQRLIFRTPTATIDSRKKGEEPRRARFPSVRASHWDPDYLEGEGRTAEIRNEECLPTEDDPPRVGLLIEGGRQHWFPVDIHDGGA